MKILKTCALVALPAMFLAACDTVPMSRFEATEATAKQAADAAAAAGAKADAAGKRAEDAARAAERAAAAAERAASQVAEAIEKANRMMQAKMRK